jgi:hypothetical protein
LHTDRLQVAAVPLGGEPDDPSPQTLAVPDEEKEDKGQESAGDHLDRDDGAAQRASGDRAGSCSQLLLSAVDELVDPGLREPEWAVPEPVLDFLEAALHAEVDVVELADRGGGEGRRHAHEQQRGAEERGECRERAGQPAALEPVGYRDEHRGEDESREDRQDDQPQPGERESEEATAAATTSTRQLSAAATRRERGTASVSGSTSSLCPAAREGKIRPGRRRLLCLASVDELPHSTRAPESGA